MALRHTVAEERALARARAERYYRNNRARLIAQETARRAARKALPPPVLLQPPAPVLRSKHTLGPPLLYAELEGADWEPDGISWERVEWFDQERSLAWLRERARLRGDRPEEEQEES